MTGSPPPARSDRWLRAILYGLLAEVATIVTIVIIVTTYRYAISPGQADAVYQAFGERTGGWVGIIGGTLYVLLFARVLMRRLLEHQVAHGVVVAVAAIALSVGGSLAGHRGVPMGYLAASVLKVAAGALAGLLAARGRATSA